MQKKPIPHPKLASIPVIEKVPILLEKAGIQDRAQAFAQIESGQLDHIDFPAHVYTFGPNANHLIFNWEDMPALAASFVGAPFLRNHEQEEIAARDGTILESAMVGDQMHQTIRLTTRQGMTDFIEGRMDRFSIAWNKKDFICTICQSSFYGPSCTHWPGQTYQTADGPKVCELLSTEPTAKETSAVNVPGVKGTSLLAALQAYKQEINGKEPDVSPDNADEDSTTLQGETMFKIPRPLFKPDGTPGGGDTATVLAENQNILSEIQKNEQERAAKLNQQIADSDALLIAQLQNLLNSSLADSNLPKATQARLRRNFENRKFKPAELSDAITEAREEIAELSAPDVIQGPGRISGMYTSGDQLQAAVDDMFGVERETNKATLKVHRLSGIRELYLGTTGDYDFHGGYHRSRALLANTGDFTGLVKNAMNKRVVQKWKQLGKEGYDWWMKIVAIEHFETLNDITGILVGTVGTLPTVGEGEEYPELAVGDSPETAAFFKQGGYIPLTLELIDRDETRKLKIYPDELASAYLRTLSSRIASIFTQNSGAGPTMADGGALFNATAVGTVGGHANLGTTALSITEWYAASNAIYKQPLLVKTGAAYAGTGPRGGVRPKFCLIPNDLRKTGRDIFINRWDTSDNKHSENLLAGEVEPVVVPDFTDATDWAAVVAPEVQPCIVLGERFGLLPEIYIAGSEDNASVFENDTHRMKVRGFNAVLVQDFRGLYKENVAG